MSLLNMPCAASSRLPRVFWLRRSGANPTRQKLMEALASIKKFDLGGHDITFAENNRIGLKFVEVTMINGAVKPEK